MRIISSGTFICKEMTLLDEFLPKLAAHVYVHEDFRQNGGRKLGLTSNWIFLFYVLGDLSLITYIFL